jgi:hypothetical protein
MSVKMLAQKMIANLPDQATFDDIQYELYVLECIEKGEQEVVQGKIKNKSQVEQGIEKWLK